LKIVIPAKAGIQGCPERAAGALFNALDSRLRGNDDACAGMTKRA